MNVEILGWIATAAFASSYIFKDPATLRRIQAGAALLWIVYGIQMRAMPVVASNVLVAAVALASTLRRERAEP
ncbi:hypothetical protein F183_A01580 [Bryobacterales bacterium F-183]|nr:hypothetical protein F183_A01580 [Bryobacterales bacterium F-183]